MSESEYEPSDLSESESDCGAESDASKDSTIIPSIVNSEDVANSDDFSSESETETEDEEVYSDETDTQIDADGIMKEDAKTVAEEIKSLADASANQNPASDSIDDTMAKFLGIARYRVLGDVDAVDHAAWLAEEEAIRECLVELSG